MARPRVLITGITGMVGSHLADFLLEKTDWDIVGMCRWRSPMDNLGHIAHRINAGDRVFLHYGEPDIRTKVDKINAYSTGLVADKLRRRQRFLGVRMLFYPPLFFLRQYVGKPDNPELIVYRIRPTRVRYMREWALDYHEVPLEATD